MKYEVGQIVRVLDKTFGTSKENSGSWKAIVANSMVAKITYIYEDGGQRWVELKATEGSVWEGEYSLNDIAPLNETLEGVEEL